MREARDPSLSPEGWTIDDDENLFRAPGGLDGPAPDPDGPDAEGWDCWADGKLLVMQKGGWLPDRCVRCGGRAGEYRLRRLLSWHPPPLYVLLGLDAAIYAVVALFVRKTTRVMVPLCPEHRRRRGRAITIGWLGGLVGVAAMIAPAALTVGSSRSGFVLVGLTVFVASLLYGLDALPVVSAKKIDPDFAWIKGVSPRFLAGLPAVGDRVESI